MTAIIQTRLGFDELHQGYVARAHSLADSALAELERGVDRSPWERYLALRLRARVQIADGAPADAHRTVQKAMAALQLLGSARPGAQINLDLVDATALLAMRDSAAARSTLRAALATVGARPEGDAAALGQVRALLDSLTK